MPHRIASALSLALLFMTSCGGGSSNAGTPATAVILFPTAVSSTERTTVTVRGTASSATAVRVNGVAATSTDGFSTWQAVVPLTPGSNTLDVDARNALGTWNNGAAMATILGQQVTFTYVRNFTFDPTSQTLWVVDADRNALIRVDLSTGVRTLLSGDGVPDATNEFDSLRDVAYDAGRNRLLALGLSTVWAVDPATGGRTVITSDSVPDASNLWSSAEEIVVDTVNERYLVSTGSGSASIYTVDPTTGARSILTSPSVPDAVSPLADASGLAVDAGGNRVLVSSSINANLIGVDLTTGARTVISSDSVPNATNSLSGSHALALDASGGRVFCALRVNRVTRQNQVVSIDLATGARTPITDQTVDAGHYFGLMDGLAWDPTNNRIFTILDFTGEILAVNAATGFRTEVAPIHTPPAPNAPFAPVGIERDPDTGTLYVTDYELDALIRIDPNTGVRTLVSGPGVPNDDAPIDSPSDVALDKLRNRALVISQGRDEIIAVDLTTGQRTLFAGPSGRNPISSPYSIVVDAARNRALVGDPAFQGITAWDLDTGVGTIFSDPTTPDMVDPMNDPAALVLDLPRNRLLVGDSFDDVFAVDLTTGARTLLAADVVGEPFARMVFDELTNTLYVADTDFYGVIAVDLTTQVTDEAWGTREGPYYDNNAWEPYGVVQDPERGVFFVTDYLAGTIVVIDAVTRERVFLSR